MTSGKRGLPILAWKSPQVFLPHWLHIFTQIYLMTGPNTGHLPNSSLVQCAKPGTPLWFSLHFHPYIFINYIISVTLPTVPQNSSSSAGIVYLTWRRFTILQALHYNCWSQPGIRVRWRCTHSLRHWLLVSSEHRGSIKIIHSQASFDARPGMAWRLYQPNFRPSTDLMPLSHLTHLSLC